MLKRTRSNWWMWGALLALLCLGGAGGCAWIMGHEGEPAAASSHSAAWDALPEPASAAARGPGMRDPFSRRMAQGYRTAAAAAAGEAGGLVARDPDVAAALAPAGKAGALAASGELPALGSGSDPDGSRLALWIAMGLVVVIGLSAMWLARRQSHA